jgi:hypothetical protein
LDEPNEDANDEEQYENEQTSTRIINDNIEIRVDDEKRLP